MAAAGDDLAAALIAGAERRREELVERLAALTALDAPSGDPEMLAAPAALLVGWLKELGAETETGTSPVGPLVDARLGDGGELLFLCHYDTVWPRGTAAARPFRVEDGVASGPGVLDMRGGIVACLGAIGLLAEVEALGRPVRVLLTPDEESGSAASAAAIAAAAERASLVLVPEPALPNGGLKTSRKGWMVYRLHARGRAAHAGLEPERGVSAVEELLDGLLAVRALADADVGTTVNFGGLQAANPPNVVADSAEALIDLRVADAEEAERLQAALAALAPQRQGAELSAELVHSRPPLERSAAIAAAAERARLLAGQLGIELEEGYAGGVSDANLAAAVGATVLDGLGPLGGGAHAVQEWVDLDSLVQRTALIALLAARL